jgi:ketosteroid isomerase-like protein
LPFEGLIHARPSVALASTSPIARDPLDFRGHHTGPMQTVAFSPKASTNETSASDLIDFGGTSMSTALARKNTKAIAGIYEACGRGDLNAVMSAMDDGAEWITPDTLPWSRGRYHGHGGLRYFAAFLTTLGEPRVEPEELIDADDRVIAIGYERGRGAASGRDFRVRFVHAWALSSGRVTRMEGLADTAAIADAISDR